MKIGNLLEIKILQAYCKQRKLILKKERGGRTLTMLYQYNYVGHTPDGKTCKSKDDEAEVLEVKVVFNMEDTLESLVKKHKDQLQLGLVVHRCNSGRLLVYRCKSNMKEIDAEQHLVDANNVEEYCFDQDKVWFAKFKPNVEAFYTHHLEWFHGSTFDMDHARNKVESILYEVKATRDTAVMKKRKLVKT